jgi:hypothetical protein
VLQAARAKFYEWVRRSYSATEASGRRFLKEHTFIASPPRRPGKGIEIRAGEVEKPRPKPKPQALDVLVDKYLEVRAMQNNWRKHTRQTYALKLFLRSCRKTRLEDVTEDDLREYARFLRRYRTSTGKRYDDRSIWNHFNNVVTFLNANGRRNRLRGRCCGHGL